MSSKTIAQSIFEAAVAARAIPAVGQAVTQAAKAAGTAVGTAAANKIMNGTEAPVAEVASQDAPVQNAGGAQNLQQNPQSSAGTNQAVAPAQQPTAPNPGDVSFNNTRLVTQAPQTAAQQAQAQQAQAQAIQAQQQAQAQAQQTQQVQTQQQASPDVQAQAQANLLRSLAGVNESGFISGLRKKVLRHG